MYIEPSTYVRLIKNCPLDNKYEHTILFNSETEQVNYFKGLQGVNFTKQTYQRYSKGVLTVQSAIGALYDCNYMMFRNESFEYKWFFAFVTRVEYVNQITCRVYYEIDVMQTWHFNYDLRECFVIREHSVTDVCGDNLVPEDIDCGPYEYSTPVYPEVKIKDTDGVERTYGLEHLDLVIMYDPGMIDLVATKQVSEEWVYKANFYSGIYQGVNFIVIPAIESNASSINTLLDGIDLMTGHGIVGIFLMPHMFIPEVKDGFNEYNRWHMFHLQRPKYFKGGFVPKNNKLFTAPYVYAHLSSNRESKDFAMEHIASKPDDDCYFVITGIMSSNTAVMAYPFSYLDKGFYLDGSVSIPAYPVCTWNTDGFNDWVNNNLFNNLSSAVTSVGTNLVNGSAPVSVSSGTEGVIRTALGFTKSLFDHGTVSGRAQGDVLWGSPLGRFIYVCTKEITVAYAKRIDDYFTMYGYATNSVKIPNRSARPWWNYVRTANCAINGKNGGVPAEDIATICSIYDKGITFWNKNAEMGAYSKYDNSPV